jgi:hypothetical protein
LWKCLTTILNNIGDAWPSERCTRRCLGPDGAIYTAVATQNLDPVISGRVRVPTTAKDHKEDPNGGKGPRPGNAKDKDPNSGKGPRSRNAKGKGSSHHQGATDQAENYYWGPDMTTARAMSVIAGSRRGVVPGNSMRLIALKHR